MLVLLFVGTLPPLHLLLSSDALYGDGSHIVVSCSLLVILVGAMITFIYGEQGYMHLRPDTVKSSFHSPQGDKNIHLPFTIEARIVSG